ncbi:MAG: hypothetical protein II837_00790, partial [Treponema sp.]|nr:hypothetical protein [Treponema sp.]
MASMIDLEKITQDIRLSSPFDYASTPAASTCISRLKLLLGSDPLGRTYLSLKDEISEDDIAPEEIVMDSSLPVSGPANRLASVLHAVAMRKAGVFAWNGSSG